MVVAMTTPIVLPRPLQSSLEAAARALLKPSDQAHIEFSRPIGEAALLSPDSVSWRVFKTPTSNSRITAEIVAAIEAGAGSWKMPWHHDGSAITRPTNVLGRRYRGVNVIALWAAAQAASYGTGLWGTYRQYQALGAQVRKCRGSRAAAAHSGRRCSARSILHQSQRARHLAGGRDRHDRRAGHAFIQSMLIRAFSKSS